MLELSNNDLSEVPFQLGYMKTLQILKIDGNRLKRIRRGVIEGGTEKLKSYLRSRDPNPSLSTDIEQACETVTGHSGEKEVSKGIENISRDPNPSLSTDIEQACETVTGHSGEKEVSKGIENISRRLNCQRQTPKCLNSTEKTKLHTVISHVPKVKTLEHKLHIPREASRSVSIRQIRTNPTDVEVCIADLRKSIAVLENSLETNISMTGTRRNTLKRQLARERGQLNRLTSL
mmetsp:Transcript_921/g.1305  ORF Transcript_921/g.1305 Transcript_921/m.1305 type:complete len:233 (+) Transcript_921:1181-1879(+)